MKVLILAASIAGWIQVEGGTWKATNELPEIQARLKPFVTQAAAQNKTWLAEWSTYTFQYQGQTKDKQRFVFISAFCSTPTPDANKHFFLSFDGGGCYFRVKYDPVKKEFFELEFNGEA